MSPIEGYILTALTSLLVGYLLTYIQPKAKVYYWSPHFFRFKLHNENNIEVQTDSLTIQNLGRKSAEDIEIILNNRPDHFQFQPPLQFAEEERADSFIVKLSRLAPKEHATLQLLSYKTMVPQLQTIRFESGIAKTLPFQIIPRVPKWLLALIWAFFFMGCYFFLLKTAALINFLMQLYQT